MQGHNSYRFLGTCREYARAAGWVLVIAVTGGCEKEPGRVESLGAGVWPSAPCGEHEAGWSSAGVDTRATAGLVTGATEIRGAEASVRCSARSLRVTS